MKVLQNSRCVELVLSFIEEIIEGNTGTDGKGGKNQGPINLATNGKSITLDYGEKFNLTYTDNAPISLCKVEKQSNSVLLRKGFQKRHGLSKISNDNANDLET